MASTINGNTGTTSGNYLIYVQQIDGRGGLLAPPFTVPVTSNTGAYSITGLAAGTYRLTLVPQPPNPSGAPAPVPSGPPALNQVVITVDGSSTYAV